MVTIEKLDNAIEEARRFLIKAGKAKEQIKAIPGSAYGCKETGAVKRSSMDLSEALIALRK